ncbi:HD domain-containing protein [Cynara cardunculus var. scolymus]|uniref:5'-deoxynucleotidase n=1 Tax=Cynara cardunculus var. scolymus TaxID=59895 RepID=A0A124SCG7_CYNCS|nr:HD domain-containing protein [Cynara cardunculus var. scolymus]
MQILCKLLVKHEFSGSHVTGPVPGSIIREPNQKMASESSSSEASLSPSPSSAIDFLSLCHRLKSTKRAGWVKRDIRGPESIADHMYRMGLMALIASDAPGVNRDKCIKMAIVHDIAEDGVPKLEKSRREKEALDHMCKLLGGGPRGADTLFLFLLYITAEEIYELWMEYEENSTTEAKVVKDFDKIEMILQALEYENEQDKDLEEFFQSTAGKFQTDVGKAWASEIASRRKKQD